MYNFDSRMVTAVPAFIEFTEEDAMDCDADNYDDLLGEDCYFDYHAPGNSSTHHIEEETRQQEHAYPDDVVTHRELDAMKHMIQEMRRNPALLHQSPVYSKSLLSCDDTIDMKAEEALKNLPTLARRSRREEQNKTFSGLVTPTAPQETMSSHYCLECNVSSSASRPKINVKALMSRAPPLPFL